jgi:hypothetical protein
VATFGDTTSGGDTFPMDDGRCILTRQTLTESATLTAVWAYFLKASGTASAKGVICANNSGTPGSVLYVTSAVAIPNANAWLQMSLSGSLTAGDYYIGVVTNDGGGVSSLGEDASPTTFDTEMANGTFTFASPPGTWPGTDASYLLQINVYVEYTTGGAGPVRAYLYHQPTKLIFN